MLVVNDCSQGLRVLIKHPWKSLAIISIIAVGTGMGSAFHSVIEALLLRPLPFDPEGQLVSIEQRLQPSQSRIMNSHQNLNDLREQSNMLDGVTVFQSASGIMGNEQTEYAQGMKVDHYFFPLLGVAPVLGRGFTSTDEQDGAPGSIILSYMFWQRCFAGDQTIVGQTIRLDKQSYTVIGIMPQSFYFPFVEQTEEDFWLPLRDQSSLRGDYDKHGLARIRPGANVHQAEAELSLISSHMRQANPGHERHSFNLRPYREVIVEQLRPMLLNLAGITVCVLLAMCINVASQLLVEAISYRHDIAVRFALGSTRWQSVRLFLFRALALASVGGLVGAGLAWALVVLVRKLLPAGFPGAEQMALNIRLLWSATALSLGAGMLCGLWPALAVTQKLHRLSLNGTRQAIVMNTMQRSRRYLVVLQLIFSSASLVVTGLLGVSFYRLLKVDPGIRLDHRLLVTVRNTDPNLKTVEALQQFFSGIQERLLSIPGVRAVAVSSYAPLSAHGVRDFRIEGVSPPEEAMEWMAQDNTVSTNYFEELGIAVGQGRYFNNEDRADSRLVVIVNDAFVHRFLRWQPPLGRQICVNSGGRCPWREIVGIVADTRDSRIENPPAPAYFIPFSQARLEYLGSAAFTVRTNIDPASMLESIHKQMLKLAPRAMGTGPYTMEEMRSRQLTRPRHRVWFLVPITILALLLAAIGVYGVIAGAVEQRRCEIGVRMAMGASRQNIVLLFYREMLSMLLPGLVVGLTLAASIASTLAGTVPIDPVAYFGAITVILFVASAATALPVHRALKMSVAEVLRTE